MAAIAEEVKKKTLSQHKVRTSLQVRTLDSMFPVPNPSRIDPAMKTDNPSTGQQKSREVEESKCFLTSVKNLRQSLAKGKHTRGGRSRSQCYLVLIASSCHQISPKFFKTILLSELLQHSTKLYLVNHGALAYVSNNPQRMTFQTIGREELFYQLGVRQFGDFSRLKLEPAPPLRTLVALAVEVEDTSQSSLSKQK
jgi:DNA mismatch repair protein MLH1